jgi:hypothetical protein
MSYCRNPYYIYDDGDGINFDFTRVSENQIDVFLYKIFLSKREEFIQRLKHGKELVIEWQNDIINTSELNMDKEDAEKYKQWLLDKEDDIFKELLNY